MSIVIQVENLSKQYRLGNVGLGSLGADVNRWWQTRILGNEDPYLKIGEENNREVIGNSEYVWALREKVLSLALIPMRKENQWREASRSATKYCLNPAGCGMSLFR